MGSAVDSEHDFMKKAVEEAKLSSPEDNRVHPKVGVVVAKDNKFLVSAFRGHGTPGNHAEYAALEVLLKDAELAGSIVYTTLEPCTTRNHPKVPCAERLAERKVAKVVVGMLDPNPEIMGKGVTALRKANIAVGLFPPDLMAALEELNREFIRFHNHQSAARTIDSEFVEKNEHRSFDEWYKSINGIYWNRNFHQDVRGLFTHLVEVIGGLSQLASHKRKNDRNPESFIPKAIAWWLTLCGKIGVKSVADMVWAKFPSVCAYCHLSPHLNEECEEKKRSMPGPDWTKLAELGEKNLSHRPAGLKEWPRMFSRIYPAIQGEEYGPSFARLTEELGELAEAIRVFPQTPGYFLSEAADVFAWLMHVQNLVEDRNKVAKAARGSALQLAFCSAYPDRCLDCGEVSCKCPPILQTTIGRIAHEVPPQVSGGYFMNAEMASKTFSPISK
jgi:pyrimidine deaminase RibD-like protein